MMLINNNQPPTSGPCDRIGFHTGRHGPVVNKTNLALGDFQLGCSQLSPTPLFLLDSSILIRRLMLTNLISDRSQLTVNNALAISFHLIKLLLLSERALTSPRHD